MANYNIFTFLTLIYGQKGVDFEMLWVLLADPFLVWIRARDRLGVSSRNFGFFLGARSEMVSIKLVRCFCCVLCCQCGHWKTECKHGICDEFRSNYSAARLRSILAWLGSWVLWIHLQAILHVQLAFLESELCSNSPVICHCPSVRISAHVRHYFCPSTCVVHRFAFSIYQYYPSVCIFHLSASSICLHFPSVSIANSSALPIYQHHPFVCILHPSALSTSAFSIRRHCCRRGSAKFVQIMICYENPKRNLLKKHDFHQNLDFWIKCARKSPKCGNADVRKSWKCKICPKYDFLWKFEAKSAETTWCSSNLKLLNQMRAKTAKVRKCWRPEVVKVRKCSRQHFVAVVKVQNLSKLWFSMKT